VNVALQVTSGRYINKFLATTSLWDILKYWEKEKGLNLTADGDVPPNSSDKTKYYMQPVITYTTKEIGTNADLRTTTLAKLGLTDGTGLLRLLHKYTTMQLDEFLKFDEQNVVSEKVAEEQLVQELQVKRLQEQKENAERNRIEREKTEAIKKGAEEEQKRMAERVKQYIKEEEELKQQEEQDERHKMEALRLQEERDKIDALRLQQDRIEAAKLQQAQNQLQKIREEKKRQSQAERQAEVQTEVPPTKESAPIEPEQIVNIERNPQVFAPSSTVFDPHSVEIPEDFYQVTAEDLKRNALIKKERKKEEEQTKSIFRTKEMRERDKAKKWAKYKKCFIRIRFPDRTELQATFGPLEKPAALYTFISESLREENRNVEFHIYTIPPKSIISSNEDTNFRDLGLLPAALVHFGLAEGSQMQMPFLRAELTNTISEKLPPPEIYIPKKEQTILTGNLLIEEPKTPKVPAPAPTEATQGEDEEPAKKLPSWFSKGKKH